MRDLGSVQTSEPEQKERLLCITYPQAKGLERWNTTMQSQGAKSSMHEITKQKSMKQQLIIIPTPLRLGFDMICAPSMPRLHSGIYLLHLSAP